VALDGYNDLMMEWRFPDRQLQMPEGAAEKHQSNWTRFSAAARAGRRFDFESGIFFHLKVRLPSWSGGFPSDKILAVG